MLATSLFQESIIAEALQVAAATYRDEAECAAQCNQRDIAQMFREKEQRARTLCEQINFGLLKGKP